MTRSATARRWALAVAGGVLLYAGHPPLDVSFAGLLTVAPLAALAASLTGHPRAGRAGFGYGLVAGVAAFAPLLEWIARFGVVPWVLLVLIQAAFLGLFVGGLARWGARPAFPVAAVALWAAVEALRGTVPLGGFPWGLLGYTQHDGGLLLPVARSVGVLGVGALCAAFGVALWRLVAALAAREGEWRRSAAVSAVALVAVLALGRASGPVPIIDGPRLDVAAVQGNDLVETAEVGHGRVLDIARRMTETTLGLADDGDLPDVVVWPENSLDRDVTTDPRLAAVIEPAVRALRGTPLLVGMLTDGPRENTFVNTASLLAPGPEVTQRYVKRKLVPFGEFVPGRRFLDWIPALDQIPRDAVAGEAVDLFSVAGARIGVAICFENIFPLVTHDLVRAGADVLVVSTNNASYGFSAASEQHLAFSRLRAVETGRWVLHAGISGISAVVDPTGRSSQETEPFQRAIVRAELPLLEGMTPAVRLGRWIEGLALLAGAVVLAVPFGGRLRRRR